MNLKNKKRILSFIVLILITLLSLNFVSAWGVAPARQYADNTQSTQKIAINILNNDFQEGYFKLSFSGKLSSYASAQENIFHLTPEEGQTKIMFDLNLPKKLDPGKNTLSVVLEQISNQQLNDVGASITLIAEVIVNVPIEGEFVNLGVVIPPSSQFTPVPITLSIFNSGAVTVPVWAEINIKGPSNEPIATITTEKKIVEVGQTTKFKEFWEGQTYQGSYVAEVTLHYGSSFKSLMQGFVVNGEKVVSEYISSNNFNLGSIVPVEIGLKNNWNLPLNGVYADIYVLTLTGDLVQQFKSISTNLMAKSTGILSAYWDTSNLVVGNYNLNVITHFDDESTQKTYPATVSLNKLSINNPTGNVAGGNSGSGGNSDGGNNTLVLLLVVLIVVNVAGLIIMKKYFSKKK